MRYCVVIADGMADEPVKRLGGKTPLEAAGMGIELGPNGRAFRCDLVTVRDGVMVDPSAGHIRSAEAKVLIAAVNARLGSREVSFHSGVSYRGVMVYRGGDDLSARCTPPREIVGERCSKHMPAGPGGDLLAALMERSQAVLDAHDVNVVRVDHGENPGTMLWIWGGGTAPEIRPFVERFGKKGAVICALDVVKGIARYLGFEVAEVPGATGYVDTDYAGKGQAALRALVEQEVVVVHVEAADEAGHEGNAEEKVRAIEAIDRQVVGPIIDSLLGKIDFRILVAADHVTRTGSRSHASDPVPFAMCGTGIQAVHEMPFSEKTAAAAGLRIERGYELMPYFLRD